MSEIEFTDLLGNEIREGTYVGYSDGHSLKVGTVEKLTSKMVKIRKLRTDSKLYRSSATTLKYPSDVIVLDTNSVTIYLLKL